MATLSDVVINGHKYVFMHDLEKTFGLSEDECFSALAAANIAPLDNTSGERIEEAINTLTLSLTEVVECVAAHIEKDPLTSFVVPPPAPSEEGTSIEAAEGTYRDLTAKHLTEADDKAENVVELDAWAGRKGGVRGTFGRDSAFAKYIGKLHFGDLVVIHKKYTPMAMYQLNALRAFSKKLCLKTIRENVEKVVLVGRSLANYTFGGGFNYKVLAHTAIERSVGLSTDKTVRANENNEVVPDSKRRRQMFLSQISNVKE